MHSKAILNAFAALVLLLFTPLTHDSARAAASEIVLDVKHHPAQPHSGETVIISCRVKDATAIKGVGAQFQVVDPGGYIALADPAYSSRWQSIPLNDDVKTGGASAGEHTYTAALPGTIQKHRRLVRYRIQVQDAKGETTPLPSSDDAQRNFAYFVYDGIPAWQGAINPTRGPTTTFDTNVMNSIQAYHLISKSDWIENATWREQSRTKQYKYTGTFVYDGKVYDHIRFRARGGEWRYAMGKNMWKIDFNRGHPLEARDDYGTPYTVKWGKLNLRACIQQGDYGHRGEQGMFEAVGFKLFNLAGVECPRTHWAQLRIVSEAAEDPPDQYRGDFWGLYLAIENEDGRFLKEHGLPDGNLYKMMWGSGELNHQGKNSVTNASDLQAFMAAYRGRDQTEAWWRANVDLPRYYSYRAILEGIHHYDIEMGKNYDYYLNPRTTRWSVIPWDIDLTWADGMFGNGEEPFKRPVLSKPQFQMEYQNRLRELRDLLFNTDQTWALIDEYAALISDPAGGMAIVDADRAKWDYHPIMNSRYAMHGKAGQGLFYRTSRTRNFAGMVELMKEYVKRRSEYIDGGLLDDSAIPATPKASVASPGGLSFRSSEFKGRGQFAALQWRVGEVARAKKSRSATRAPGIYEITPVWESGELSRFIPDVSIPEAAIKTGHSYRARVRMKDAGGHWSHWSEAVQFSGRNTAVHSGTDPRARLE